MGTLAFRNAVSAEASVGHAFNFHWHVGRKSHWEHFKRPSKEA
jgi:hypothetical protein